jgi:hypothetical protein
MRHEREGSVVMTTVLTPTVDDLRRERESLVDSLRLAEDELRTRAEDFLLSAEETRVLRRLDQIDYLLGED